MPTPRIIWPEGKSFAFTAFDDTDAGTMANVPHVYGFLAECGFRTTKSVWPIQGVEDPMVVGGATCADAAFLRWHQDLQKQGFEMGWHNATYHSSKREDTLRALELFRKFFGHYPVSMANHTICEEGLYWGENRLTGLYRQIYNLLNRYKAAGRYRGHVPNDPFFWGDAAQKHLQFVRNFVFADINTLKACPLMPYHDPLRPYANGWYASSEGTRVEPFNVTISEANQDRLEAEGGACIMYTHFAKGFYADGQVQPRFRELMRRLSKKNGWFVPVSTLLQFLRETKGLHQLAPAERNHLERKWLLHKVRVGTT